MDEPHPDAVPDQRGRVRPRKDKGIALEDINFVSEDLPLPGWNPGLTPGDGSGTSEAPLPDDFFANLPPGFTTPASLDEALRKEVVAEGSRLINEGMWVFNSTLDGSFREARLSHFKAEEIERKFIRFQKEVAERERRQAESHSRALIRAERKGRRTIAAELARRATLFDADFRSFKDAQDYVGDFRECRGSVGTLWKSQNIDFSFLSEVAEMSGLMDGCAHAESMVPPIEGRIRELWEPIEVSEDTTEAGADAADEGGEVDQPVDSLGVSMSGFGRAIGIQEVVLYACDLRNFAGEELRSKTCAENLAVHSGMTSGLGKLAVGIILELVPSPVLGGRSESRRWSYMHVTFEISPARSFAARLVPRTLQFIVE
ncbi:hypothetical protein F2Q68_00044318 [Brassica cretica]|uniref:Uncharacterized protein n=1 Tax=Brassica cretica TaxID=69181 RepID=A0A8S9LTI6_BRACR|nr:hypothetical protein F2Q68_00044318 [Brassica cretica]